MKAFAIEMEKRAFEDKSLPILAVVSQTDQCMIKVSKEGSAQLGEVVDTLFEGEFLGGLRNLMSTALKELLGNASGGEKEKREFHIVYANNRIRRVDYHMYKYDFSSKGLREKAENVFCYVVQVAVLDLKKVDPQVFLYQLNRASCALGEGCIQKATK